MKAEDIASYDDVTEKCYVLDAGNYNFYIGTVGQTNYGSHSWAYATADSTAAFPNAVIRKVIYNENNPRNSEKFAHNDIGVSYHAATNTFDEELTGNNLKTKNGSKTMSRADIAATFPTAPGVQDRAMPAALKAKLESNLFDTKELVQRHNKADDQMPLTNQDYGLDLVSLRGLDYDDPAWDKFIQQFKISEMQEFAEKSGWATVAVERLGKPMTVDNDGPQGLKYNFLGAESGATETVYLTAYPCAVVLAATFNTELLMKIGESIGEEGLLHGVNGWYAPGLNTHRTPFSGRNFEYFSEDPLLAGKLCAAEVSGAASKGLYAYVKHFALNDQESFARAYNAGKAAGYLNTAYPDCMLLTWATEQTMREVYLKSFEIVFKEAVTDIRYLDSDGNVKVKENFRAATAVMTAFNCVGNTWAGGDYNLITSILREEWGFKGFVLTDSIRNTPYMYSDQMLRAGGDACLMNNPIPLYDTESATAVKGLQATAKNICYTVAHSAAMSDIAPGSKIRYTLAPWAIGLLVAWIATGLFITGIIVFTVRRILDEKKNPDRYKKATR